MSARQRFQALAQGRGDGRGIAVPLALAPAARIQERDWEDFTEDPTELANGLRDLHQAVAPDGLVVSLPELLVEQGLIGPHAVAAVEATRRLRASLGDQAALVAALPGPEDFPPDALLDLGKEFLAAGVDLLLVFGEDPTGRLATLANVARFHQAVVVFAADTTRPPLDAPAAAAGVVLTDDWLARETDLSVLEDWVDAVRG